MTNKPLPTVKELERHIKQKAVQPKPEPHHSGKGTRARINTSAEKLMFGNNGR